MCDEALMYWVLLAIIVAVLVLKFGRRRLWLLVAARCKANHDAHVTREQRFLELLAEWDPPSAAICEPEGALVLEAKNDEKN